MPAGRVKVVLRVIRLGCASVLRDVVDDNRRGALPGRLLADVFTSLRWKLL